MQNHEAIRVIRQHLEKVSKPHIQRGVRASKYIYKPFFGIDIEADTALIWIDAVHTTIPQAAAQKELEEVLNELKLKPSFFKDTKSRNIYHVPVNQLLKNISKHGHLDAQILHKNLQLTSAIAENALSDAHAWAMLLTQDISRPGPYFPTRLLREIADKNSPFQEARFRLLGSNQTHFILHEDDPQIATKVASAIEDLGFRRIAYQGHGHYSIAFRGIEDKSGREQLIVLTPPSDDNYIPHPCILPAIKKNKLLQEKQHWFYGSCLC